MNIYTRTVHDLLCSFATTMHIIHFLQLFFLLVIYMYPHVQNKVPYLLSKFSQELFNIEYLSHSFLSTIVVHMFVFLLFYAHLVVIRKFTCHPYITSHNFSPGTIFNRTASFLFFVQTSLIRLVSLY